MLTWERRLSWSIGCLQGSRWIEDDIRLLVIPELTSRPFGYHLSQSCRNGQKRIEVVEDGLAGVGDDLGRVIFTIGVERARRIALVLTLVGTRRHGRIQVGVVELCSGSVCSARLAAVRKGRGVAIG